MNSGSYYLKPHVIAEPRVDGRQDGIQHTEESNLTIHPNPLVETSQSRAMSPERLFGEKKFFCIELAYAADHL
jgi:hypothetical protein